MDRPKCSQCGEEFGESETFMRIASISGSVMGDEYTDSYFYCSRCGVYTVGNYHDHFMVEESVSFSGPVPKSKGDASVEIIKRCSKPWNKKCRCEAHVEYFGNSLD